MPPKKPPRDSLTKPETASTARSKRRASPDHEDDRIQRKRAQNRISQQCVREKNLARVTQMQTLAKVMQSSSRDGKTDSAALDAQLALVEENQQLRETLLQMRKKLLSLSTAASAAADDSVFEKMFGLKRRKKSEPSPHIERSNMKDDSSCSSQQDEVRCNTYAPAPSFASSPPGPSTRSPPDPKMGAPPTAYYPNKINTSHAEISSVFGPGMVWSPGKSLMETEDNMDSFDSTTKSFTFQHDVTLEGFDLPMISTPSLPNVQMNFFTNDFRKLFLNLPASHLQKIEEACNVCISARLGIQPIVNPLGTEFGGQSHFDISKTNVSVEQFERTVADVAAIGCELITKMSGLESFIYGIGANELLEKIMRWRLSPTLPNRLAIPEPHRPTPLQFKSNCYPLSIDLVHWPSLRDQLILDYGSGSENLDNHIGDIFLFTVIDFPQFNVSMNVYDLFLTRLLPRVGDKLSIWTHNNNIHHTDISTVEHVAEETMVSKMLQRVQEIELSRSMSNLREPPPSVDTKPTKFTGPAGRTLQLALKYGLHTQKDWKLHSDFARKYPLLDCSSALSKYPLYSSALVPDF